MSHARSLDLASERLPRPLLLVFACWLFAAACQGDEPISRRLDPQPGGVPAPVPAAGAGGVDRIEDLLPPPGDVFAPLPDDADAGTLPLPRTAAAKPAADPSITFDWQESEPLASTCEPGEYTGMFSCVFELHDEFAQMLGFMIPMTGPVTLVLARSMNGEFLEITDGRFEAVAESIIGARASIRGKLDCRTRRFEATLEDGSWAIGDPTFPLLPGGALTGQIVGTYDAEVISGEWNLGDPALGDCPGTWTTRLTP